MLTPGERGQLAALRQLTAEAHRRIDRDPETSAEGKARAHRREDQAAGHARAKLLAAADARDRRAIADTRYRLFGYSGGSETEDRTARADAKAITSPDDARRELASALANGHAMWARALAEHAWNMRTSPLDGQHWQAVLGDYANSSPQRDRDLCALHELTSGELPNDMAALRDRLYRDPLPQRSGPPASVTPHPTGA